MAVDMKSASSKITNDNSNFEETAFTKETDYISDDEETSNIADNLKNGNSELPTIYAPQNLTARSDGSNNNGFPSISSSEPETESSYKKIEDAAYSEILKQSLNNDIIIGELLQHYSNSFKDKQQQKSKLKNKFFCWIMILLSVITAGCFALPILAIFFKKDIATIIVSASASVIEFSIAFLKLPKIVAEYLFDKGEDKAMAKFVSDTHKYTLKRTNRKK